MNSKTKNILSLILNVLIVIFTIYAISKFWISMGDGNMQDKGAECLKYFTNLSNIFVALASICMIPENIKNLKTGDNTFTKWVFLLKFVATISVTVTFLTCVFFLGPMTGMMFAARGMSFFAGFTFLFKGNVFFLHFITPLISIISVVLFEKMEGFTKKQAALGILPTFVYSILYFYMVIIVGSENGGWTDFYGFSFGGNMVMCAVSAAVMYLGSWGLSLLECKLNLRVNQAK